MAGKVLFIVVMVAFWMLSAAYELAAEPKKVRTDLTGRLNITPEEIITGLTSQDPQTRTRGLKKTRHLTRELPTVAVTIHFAFDSAEILPQAVSNLKSFGQALQSPELADYQIRIEGHTDSTGPAAYNLGLSQRRAKSVKQYLVKHFNIDTDRLLTEGRGEGEPIASNATPAGRGKNRRAEFVNLNTTVSSR